MKLIFCSITFLQVTPCMRKKMKIINNCVLIKELSLIIKMTCLISVSVDEVSFRLIRYRAMQKKETAIQGCTQSNSTPCPMRQQGGFPNSMYTPLGNNPGGVLIFDIKHEEGAILTGSEEHSIIVCQHELSDG